MKKMNQWTLNNKILEEEGTMERSEEEEIAYADHQADVFIREMEDYDLSLEGEAE